jgi:pimeloyl-ACP methyl ester carboxylesterase
MRRQKLPWDYASPYNGSIMEPWLRYAATADGVSIAYAVAGQADPLLRVTGGLWDHAQGYWRIAPIRRQLERLSERFTHIQYDSRGTGLSQRGAADFHLETQLLDLEAVVAANHLTRFDLLAHFTGGFAAMTYAANNPEKVARLVLFRPHLKGSDYFNSRVIRAMAGYRQMAAEDWFGYLGTVANRTMRFEHPDLARELVGVYNESMTPETIHVFEEQYRDIDVSDVPEKIQCPTLIVVDTDRSGVFEDSWRDVAALIPSVSLQMVRTDMPLAYSEAATDAIMSFLVDEKMPTRQEPDVEVMQVRLYISTAGDGSRAEGFLRERANASGAIAFETAEDGFDIAFRSAQVALDMAIDLQQTFRDGALGALKIGIDAMDVGGGEEKAGQRTSARAERANRSAEGGHVLVTDVVRQLVSGKGYRFEEYPSSAQADREPLRFFELVWKDR